MCDKHYIATWFIRMYGHDDCYKLPRNMLGARGVTQGSEMTDLPPRGGGPSWSERSLASLYWPGVGVLGRALFACKRHFELGIVICRLLYKPTICSHVKCWTETVSALHLKHCSAETQRRLAERRGEQRLIVNRVLLSAGQCHQGNISLPRAVPPDMQQ